MSNREYESREMNQGRKEESSNSFLLGALLGGVVGAAAALLLAPKSGKELRSTLSSQSGSLKDITDNLKDNVLAKGNDLLTKTSSLSQGLAQQSSEILNKVKGMTPNSSDTMEETELNYIPIHHLKENSVQEDSVKLKPLDSSEIRKKLEEAQKAFDVEESKIKL